MINPRNWDFRPATSGDRDTAIDTESAGCSKITKLSAPDNARYTRVILADSLDLRCGDDHLCITRSVGSKRAATPKACHANGS